MLERLERADGSSGQVFLIFLALFLAGSIGLSHLVTTLRIKNLLLSLLYRPALISFPFCFLFLCFAFPRNLRIKEINGKSKYFDFRWVFNIWSRRREEEHKPGALASLCGAAGEPAAGWDSRRVLPSSSQWTGEFDIVLSSMVLGSLLLLTLVICCFFERFFYSSFFQNFPIVLAFLTVLLHVSIQCYKF